MNRDDLIQQLLKDLKSGDVDSEVLSSLIEKGDNINSSRLIRDVMEEGLGDAVLRNTGVKIPSGTRASTLESFLKKVVDESYPELKNTGIEVLDDLDNMGEYDFGKNVIKVGKKNNRNLAETLGTTLHEAGHALDGNLDPSFKSVRDDDWSNKRKLLKDMGIKSGRDLSKMNPIDLNEIVQTGHHKKITGREGSYGLSNIKNVFKGNKLRALPIIGTALAGMSALSSGDVEAGVRSMLPFIGDSTDLGPRKGSEGSIIEDPTKSQEERQKAMQRLIEARNQQ